MLVFVLSKYIDNNIDAGGYKWNRVEGFADGHWVSEYTFKERRRVSGLKSFAFW